ncbi:putative phage tail protein [Tepidibacter hydrothermalis]|uniref:DUF2313 domain-containing protein n=1 Tax=Tepidibacter hydrothermalis TaxID=3036126 RepID=A0ABY8ELW9_9FIRM|nr:putative phage tail protein [Tepidibacter hydrothermalis]WFD12448.1 hypothetical protein P4S50_19915 [Tepidibacter hydrothermalis]
MSQYDYKQIIESQLPEGIYKGNSIETNAVGNTLNKIQADLDMTEKEVNPLAMANTNLTRWESFFKLPSNIQDDVQIRRARVISEFIQYMSDENVIRKDEMEAITALYADSSEVIEHFSQFLFDVILKVTGENTIPISIKEVCSVIQRIKPSWTSYTLGIDFKIKDSNLNIGVLSISGEEITLYPKGV